MRNYECMYILHPELSEEEVTQFVERYENLIINKGGVIDKIDVMGKRKLSYEIDKLNDGFYVLMLFQGEPAVAQELERVFKITEKVIRYLVVRLEDTVEAEEKDEDKVEETEEKETEN